MHIILHEHIRYISINAMTKSYFLSRLNWIRNSESKCHICLHFQIFDWFVDINKSNAMSKVQESNNMWPINILSESYVFLVASLWCHQAVFHSQHHHSHSVPDNSIFYRVSCLWNKMFSINMGKRAKIKLLSLLNTKNLWDAFQMATSQE